MENIIEAWKQVAEELAKQMEPLFTFNWLKIHQKIDKETAKHLGQWKVINGGNVRFLGTDKVYFYLVNSYYRVEHRAPDGKVLARTVLFKDISKAYDLISGKKYTRVEGDEWQELLFGLLILDSGEVLEAVYQTQRTSYSAWRTFSYNLRIQKLNPYSGIIRLTTKEVNSKQGGVYYTPVFDLIPFDNIPKNLASKLEKADIISKISSYRAYVEKYYNYLLEQVIKAGEEEPGATEDEDELLKSFDF